MSHFESATSLGEYHSLCEQSAKPASNGRKQPRSVSSEDQYEHTLPSSSVAIGRFQHAVHYRNGLFSQVYKASEVSHEGDEVALSNTVALKVTTPSTMIAPHNSRKEARILRSLQGKHRIIPMIEDFQLPGDRFILVFPFMPLSVDTLLAGNKLDRVSAKSHLEDLFSALTFLHSHSMIHRDVKPSNLLLRSVAGPAYLSDFGISWAPDDHESEEVSQKITDVGTTCYRSPEILFGKRDYDQSLDMWAAGCVAAELVDLSSKTLFESGNVGTELALIQSIFMTLGTADEENWPSAPECPDWGKMQWKQFQAKPWKELLPRASPDGRDLVSSLVQYDWRRRLSARASLSHPFFDINSG